MINFNSKIIKNKNITHEGVLAYIGIMYMCENKIDRLYTAIDGIELALKDDFELADRYFKEKIKRGLINLKENNIIRLQSKKEEITAGSVIIIDILNFEVDSILQKNSLLKIMSCSKYKKFETETLLRYYINYLMSIDDEDLVGTKSIVELAKSSYISDGIAKKKYNSILENLELIYICRSNAGNVYGEYKNKNIIEEWYKNNKYTIDNPNVDQIKKICRNSINDWKDTVDKICCITGSAEEVEIHHAKSFQMLLKETIEELNIDLNNFGCAEILEIQEVMIQKHKGVKAVPLTRSLHKELHKKYGQIVTEEQTLEFINEKLLLI